MKKDLTVYCLALASAISLNTCIHTFENSLGTPYEIYLEERLGAEIRMGLLEKSERDILNAKFILEYNVARDNWDNFDEQFDLIENIYLGDEVTDTAYIMMARDDGSLFVRKSRDQSLIHELAHFWHFDLPKKNRNEFEERWNQITGGRYIDPDSATYHDILENGSVARYAMKNIREDVAVTTELVYLLNNPQYIIGGIPNEIPEFREVNNKSIEKIGSEIKITDLEKILGKISLLEEYGFMSEREKEYAIRELSNYSPEN